ncbi:hypothetical protein [Pseudalkalibacillus berkeleyi]|uniref:Uncharacterized protein n=1 Tax=Pseudalkalibacillus berkeleyi TaxID=1069813 RepID=A0ABS9GUR9_9BACL|nr:hypothetical protein [Pseudalkalibacillus berkeleyi]MCF6136588.1 hypothetical protein [Pseudalkalibacillus berkeleyi]
MKLLAAILLLVNSTIFALWLMNAQYLFSFWGVVVWVTSIIVGILVYKRLIGSTTLLKRVLIASNYLMIFLFALTIAIQFITSSMP